MVSFKARVSCYVGYSFLGTCREHMSGGGTGVVFKSSLNIKPSIPALSFDSFEHTDVCTTTADHFRIVVIYHPPSSSITQFFDEFEVFITGLALYSGRLIITGDFNIHVENVNSSNVQRLQELLTVTNFTQIVNGRHI